MFSTLLIVALVRVGTGYHNTIEGEYPYPEERCGCARSIPADGTPVNCQQEECRSIEEGYCEGGYYGCPNNPGTCPLPGGYRNGYCHEPYGTHKVCADTNKEVLDWFASVGNNLSSVVAPGMGWCLCKHWTRGAICCHDGDDGLLKGAINFKASDMMDPDVKNIADYAAGRISKKVFCCNPDYPLAGCTPQVCQEPDEERPNELPEEAPRVPKSTECANKPEKEIMNGVTPWAGSKPDDFFNEYNNVFKTNNRNAASHLWASFLLLRSTNLTDKQFVKLFGSFCPVSGSIVYQSDQKRWGVPIKNIAGEEHFGFFYFCCWPCVCDSQDFIRIDTKSVMIKQGNKTVEREYMFTVIANPCEDEEAMEKDWTDPFDRRTTNLKHSAPELKCEQDPVTGKKKLVGAVLSDHGYPIIGMYHDAVRVTKDNVDDYKCTVSNSNLPGRMVTMDDGTKYNSHCELLAQCNGRAQQGYNSGMGQIFRKVAEIGKYHAVCATQETGEDYADKDTPTCEEIGKRKRQCKMTLGCHFKKGQCHSDTAKDSCEVRENTKAKGGKKKNAGKAKSPCECHDLCKDHKMKGYLYKHPISSKARNGRCTCLAGNKRGKIKFPAKEDARYISGTVA